MAAVTTIKASCPTCGEVELTSADITLRVPSIETPVIQEVHLAVGHILCDAVERALIGAPETFGMGRIH